MYVSSSVLPRHHVGYSSYNLRISMYVEARIGGTTNNHIRTILCVEGIKISSIRWTMWGIYQRPRHQPSRTQNNTCHSGQKCNDRSVFIQECTYIYVPQRSLQIRPTLPKATINTRIYPVSSRQSTLQSRCCPVASLDWEALTYCLSQPLAACCTLVRCFLHRVF